MNEVTQELARMWAMLSIMFAFGGIWAPAEAYMCAETLPPNLPPGEVAGWESARLGHLDAWDPRRTAD